jgi:hypothetical protein
MREAQLLEEGEQRFDELSTFSCHLKYIHGNFGEQKKSSTRLDVCADRLGVGPTTSKLNVRDGTLLKEVTRSSTMTK